MADAGVATPGTSADVVVRLVRSEGTVDVPNNRSYLSCDLYLAVTAANGATGPFKLSPASSAWLDSSLGSMGGWSAGYDLRPASSLPSLHLIHWEGWVTHEADGKKTVTFSFGFSGSGGTPLGNGSGTDSIILTAIPRGGAQHFDTAWRDQLVEYWDGSAHRLQVVEHWNGSAWIRQR